MSNERALIASACVLNRRRHIAWARIDGGVRTEAPNDLERNGKPYVRQLSMPLDPTKKKKKLKHLVTRSAHRELLLSRPMRPFELNVALLSPAFHVAARTTSRRALARMTAEQRQR